MANSVSVRGFEAHLKAVVPRCQDERFHEVEVVVVAGGLAGGGVGVADEAGLEEAAAHHHGVQHHYLVPRHVDVQAFMVTRTEMSFSIYYQGNQNSVSGMVGPFGRRLPLCFDRVMVALYFTHQVVGTQVRLWNFSAISGLLACLIIKLKSKLVTVLLEL